MINTSKRVHLGDSLEVTVVVKMFQSVIDYVIFWNTINIKGHHFRKRGMILSFLPQCFLQPYLSKMSPFDLFLLYLVGTRIT